MNFFKLRRLVKTIRNSQSEFLLHLGISKASPLPIITTYYLLYINCYDNVIMIHIYYYCYSIDSGIILSPLRCHLRQCTVQAWNENRQRF